MHFIAMPGTTAKTGSADEGFEPITEGDEVRFSVQGFRWGQVIDQRKQLPAHAGFKAGQACSGDVYTIRLAGWSAETKNPQAAEKAEKDRLRKEILAEMAAEKAAQVA